METVPNLNTSTPETRIPLHVPASEVLSKIPDGSKEAHSNEQDTDSGLEEFENLFGNLDRLDKTSLDPVQKKEARFEMARQNEFIEREFEQAFISALIQLRAGAAKAGWAQAFRGAMNIARPKLLPIVKTIHPEANEQDIEHAFATMAFQTMDRIEAGRIATPELEEIRREVLKIQPSKKEITPPQHPQPAAFINELETTATSQSRYDTKSVQARSTEINPNALQQEEISHTPPKEEPGRTNTSVS